MVPDILLQDTDGHQTRLSQRAESGPSVVVFFGVECPLARLYGPRLCQLIQRYRGRVSFIGVNSNARDDVNEVKSWGRMYAPGLPLFDDTSGEVATVLGATRNPQVVLLNSERRILYRGRIDDQYTTTAKKTSAIRQDLVEAIEECLSGQSVTVAETIASGCYIDRPQEISASSGQTVTYHQHIAPIIRRRCVRCHREGQSAPLELTDYDEVASWIDTIAEVIDEGRMPPWYANPRFGAFENFAGLTPAEKNLLHRWIAAGGPPGDCAGAVPLPPLPNSEWNIGQPDQVFSIPQPYTVAAEGEIEYQYFVVDPGFTEDKWVAAAEVRPTNPSVVHHCNVWTEESDCDMLSIDSLIGLASGYLVVTAPGRPPMVFPAGMAKRIPAGAKLVFQLHYQSIGSPQADQTRLGLKFADPMTVRQEVVTRGMFAMDDELDISPGDPEYHVRMEQTLEHNLLLLALTPHMHLRGKTCRYTVNYPNGESEILLDIPRWNSDWQDRYVLAQHKYLPAGTQVIATAVFDNSAANPFNPDPTASVHYGPQLTDEMFNAWYEAVLADQDRTAPVVLQLLRGWNWRTWFFPLAAFAALVLAARFIPSRTEL